MSNYALTLISKPKDDGSYQYSTSIWQDGPDREARSQVRERNFQNEAELTQQMNALIGSSGDANNMLPLLHAKGSFVIPANVSISDEQAESFGWIL